MILKEWCELPPDMQNEAVRHYYDELQKKKISLFCKLIFDRIMALSLLIVLLPIFLIVAILIKLDSPGEIMFRQIRVTQYGRQFRIFKFRTMVKNAEQIGTQVTTNQDMRVTKIGRFLRKCRLDEVPQLLNILAGDMSFVGTRPEVTKYVESYTEEMKATLLLPAGVTSEASIAYKDEETLLNQSEDVEKTYVKQVLPEKMKWNLNALLAFNFCNELKITVKTVIAVLKG